MKVALRSLLLAALAALPVIDAVDTLYVSQDNTRFTVDRWDDSRTYPNRITFSKKGVKSVYSYTADGKVKKIVVGSKTYLVTYKANGDVKKVSLSGSRRTLVEEGDVETYEGVGDKIQEGAAMFDPRRQLLTGYACEDCEDTMEKMCGVGLKSVCQLKVYTSPFDSNAVASIKTMCTTFGRACRNFTAQQVCADNQCVPGTKPRL